ncbi:hypothetical protein A6R68_10617 [Neotoma lepida]|uniref:AJAP1/PANP C-terminal domain-containing protein n=1 Tax=Neotoma lepida TaxID=56216 RepID=A0A1A6FWE5_NEOLE|nr:hypothetical protein A6R68_10617 [Neotoma lepida]
MVAAGTAEHQSLLRRGRRHTHDAEFNDFDFRGGRPTTETEFIAWGPTGDEEALESNTFPGGFGPTTVSILQTRKTTVATTTTTASTATAMTLQTKGVTESLDPWKRTPVGVSTTEPSTSPSNNGKDIQPPRILGETSGRSWGRASGGGDKIHGFGSLAPQSSSQAVGGQECRKEKDASEMLLSELAMRTDMKAAEEEAAVIRRGQERKNRAGERRPSPNLSSEAQELGHLSKDSGSAPCWQLASGPVALSSVSPPPESTTRCVGGGHTELHGRGPPGGPGHSLHSPPEHTSYLRHTPAMREEPGPQGVASRQDDPPPSIPSVSGPEEGRCDSVLFP